MYQLLICDDEITLRTGMKKLIEHSGRPFQICGLASNGLEALDMIKKFQPAIVLMDINMPGMSGLDVIEETRRMEIPSAFIIISGHDEFQYAQRACRLEVSDYLLKPIHKEELFSLLDRIIKKLSQGQPKEGNVPEKLPEPTSLPLSRQLLCYLQEHFSDSSLSLQFLADLFHLSPSYVTRLIKQESGKSFTDLLNHHRIQHACLLLTTKPDMKLWAVAEACGFTSQHYFCRAFKQATGITPAEYRKQA